MQGEKAWDAFARPCLAFSEKMVTRCTVPVRNKCPNNSHNAADCVILEIATRLLFWLLRRLRQSSLPHESQSSAVLQALLGLPI